MNKLIMIMLFILSSVAMAQEKDEKLSEALIRLSQINIQDGVSHKEAQIIAEAVREEGTSMISRVKGKTKISRSSRVISPVAYYSRWFRQSF